MTDKYGVGQDPYCYPHSDVLRNLLDIHSEEELQKAERELSEIAISRFRLLPPPYDLSVLQHAHKTLFAMFTIGPGSCVPLTSKRDKHFSVLQSEFFQKRKKSLA
jgi:putative exporter of polyketide antibiotics